MKRATFKSLLVTASLLITPAANASGFIVVDPAFGGPATTVAFMPGVRPPVVPAVPRPPRPPARPPVRPPAPPPSPTTPAPDFPVLHGHVTFGLSLKSQSVKVDINDQVAKTYISQTFFNNTDRDLAGTYLFPLPDDTTFSSFSLHIDGKPVEGKILEAAEARQQYEEIVRSMVDPGLLEYADHKTVRARIFPIPAHGTKKVELEYTQVLRADNGMLKYRFPLKTENQSEPVEEVNVNVKLASSQGLRTIWSPSHTVSADRSDDHHAKISLLEKNTVPDKDFTLYYSVSDKELAANLLTHKDDADYGYFLLTLTPPAQTKQVIAKDIVLVADTSGSMSGEKMEQCRKALLYVVNALNEQDRFNVVEFNTDVAKFRPGLVAATSENKKAAETFIKELESRGGTNIGDALQTGKALLSEPSERPAFLVFLTDGLPTVGETDIPTILTRASNTRNIRIFDFGVGYDVNTKLLNRLAEQNHGSTQYVEPEENLETALSGFYQKIKSPVLSDVSLAYEGLEVKDVYPKEVKDIFSGSQVLLIGKYKGSGKATVNLKGQVNGVAKAYSFPLSIAADETDHTYLPRLWAMRRIGYLTDVAQDNGNTREVVDEIVALSKRYGIISAYTSFLVTDPSEGRGTGRARPMPMGGPAPMTGGGGGGGGSGPFPGAGPRPTVSINSLPPTRLSAFVSDSRFDGHIYGDEGAGAFRVTGSSVAGSVVASGFSGRLLKSEESGKSAVVRSKASGDYKSTTLAVDREAKEAAGIKSVEGKTFYLKDGIWTDSSFEPDKGAKPEEITFGSKEYFDLMRNVPGIGKFLAVGRQVIVVYKGHIYKIIEPKTG